MTAQDQRESRLKPAPLMVSIARVEAWAADVSGQLRSASPEAVLSWANDTFPGQFAITCSMGDTVLAHMASRVTPGIPALFLDTGYHFAETLTTLAAVEAAYNLDVRILQADQTVPQQDAKYGTELYARDPDLCCRIRKSTPLKRALLPFAIWGSGIRRDENNFRASTQVVAWDQLHQRLKVSPLAAWSKDDLNLYAEAHELVSNPLTAAGYASIGCRPCTVPVKPGDDDRSGRWAGRGKTECGIHVQPAAVTNRMA